MSLDYFEKMYLCTQYVKYGRTSFSQFDIQKHARIGKGDSAYVGTSAVECYSRRSNKASCNAEGRKEPACLTIVTDELMLISVNSAVTTAELLSICVNLFVATNKISQCSCSISHLSVHSLMVWINNFASGISSSTVSML